MAEKDWGTKNTGSEGRRTKSSPENTSSLGSNSKPIFKAIHFLLIALDSRKEADAKTAACNAVAMLLGYLDTRFETSRICPMLKYEEEESVKVGGGKSGSIADSMVTKMLEERKAAERSQLKFPSSSSSAAAAAIKDEEGMIGVTSTFASEDFMHHRRSRVQLTSTQSITSSHARRKNSINSSMVDMETLERLHVQMRKKKEAVSRWFIHPSHPTRVFWDVACLVIVLIDSIIMPWQIAFQKSQKEDAWFYFGTFVFAFDIILNFQTGYVAGPLEKDHGQVVTTRWRIAKYYLRSWFFIDLVSTMPWTIVMRMAVDTTGSDVGTTRVAKITKVMKLARFMRLARMLKLLKLQSLWDSFENCIGSVFVVQILNLTKVIAFIVYACHWNACVWFLLGKETDNIFRDDDPLKGEVMERWTTVRRGHTFVNHAGEERTTTFRWQDRDPGEQYVFCFYWTLGVMRTMPVEVYPVNVGERLYTLVFMFFAFSMFSICISRITQMYNKLSTRRAEYDENIGSVRSYMHEHDIDLNLQERILTYLEYRYVRRRIFAKEHIMFAELSDSLRGELKCAQFAKTLQLLWIFKDITSDQLTPIVMNCVLDDTAPGDLLAQAGTIAIQTSILISGSLTLEDPSLAPGTVKRAQYGKIQPKLTRGWYPGRTARRPFEKDELVSVDADALLFKHASLSEFSIWAQDYCELTVIDKDAFLRVRRQNPKLNAHLDGLLKSKMGARVMHNAKKRGRDAGMANLENKAWETGGKNILAMNKRGQNHYEEQEDSGGAVVAALG